MAEINLPFKEREINGTLYRATALMLDQWAELSEYLAGIIGGPIASVLRGDAVLSNAGISQTDVEIMVGGILTKLTKQRILDLCRFMAVGLRAGEKLLGSEQQKLWWPHHMKDFAPVIALFIEVQYADFFEGLAGSLPKSAVVSAEQTSD